MPRFYFDMVMNGDTEPDEVGTTLPDAHLARRQAVVAAAEMAKALARDGHAMEVAISIRDDAGRAVATVRLSLSVSDQTGSPQRALR
jgi:hypothetical protein